MKPLSDTFHIPGLLAGLCVTTFCLTLSAAEQHTSSTTHPAAVMLLYEEKESDTDSYLIRIIVTDDYLRSDDGINNGGYILFDRKQRVLYSVLPENQRILVLTEARFDSELPDDLAFKTDVKPDNNAPRIQGHQTYTYTLTAGDQVCQEAIVVPGLLEGAVKAIGEVRALLAGRQFRDLERTPEEYRTPCFLANYVYAPGANLEHGLPIQESNNDGLSRLLIDFDANFEVDAALLEVPKGYREFTMP